MTFAIEAQDLGKRYGKTWALRACSLQLPAGRVVGLVGPNGAGKTTLLHLAMGLLTPSVGSIQIFGRTPAQDVRAVLGQVGFVAQNRPLYKSFTVAQMLEFGARLNVQWDEQRALDRLQRYHIPLDRRVGKLSGGQQAQISLAMALAKRPTLLLLDEPLANLDPLARQEFLRTMLSAAAEEGTTVVFSSHVVAELGRFCDYLILIMQGQVQLAGDIDDLLASHQRLTSDIPTSAELACDPGVVSLTSSGRQSAMIVRKDAGISRIGWTEHALALEDLVLGYMTSDSVIDGARYAQAQRKEMIS